MLGVARTTAGKTAFTVILWKLQCCAGLRSSGWRRLGDNTTTPVSHEMVEMSCKIYLEAQYWKYMIKQEMRNDLDPLRHVHPKISLEKTEKGPRTVRNHRILCKPQSRTRSRFASSCSFFPNLIAGQSSTLQFSPPSQFHSISIQERSQNQTTRTIPTTCS